MSEEYTTLERGLTAEVEFTVRWKSPDAEHEERYLGRQVDVFRDLFPVGLEKTLQNAEVGAISREVYIPGKVVPGFRPRKKASIAQSFFKRFAVAGREVRLAPGRFYPYSLLSGHPGIRSSDIRPAFRVVDLQGSDMVLDFNHPLAAHELDVTAEIKRIFKKKGRSKLPMWMEEICDDGPGMQVRPGDGRTQFITDGALGRSDVGDDSLFYSTARMVGHVDVLASSCIGREYASRLSAGAKVLDHMAGWQSHLPCEVDAEVVGLGMNREEMEANPRLARCEVQDLNKESHLPFENGVFDAVLNSLSLEYLTDPTAAVAEVARVLKPGGVFMVALSNRWFPEKAIAMWPELHDFERMGYALDLMLGQGFKDCWTVSIRNNWRPQDDPHYHETWDSDPVYIVGGVKA